MSLLYSLMTGFLVVTYEGLELYKDLIILSVVLSWLVNFNIINTQNRFVRMIGDFLYRITEPALRPIRRVVPPLGGFDLSPVILFFIIMFLQIVVQSQAARLGH